MAKWTSDAEGLRMKLHSIQSELIELRNNYEGQFTNWAPEGSKLDTVSDHIYDAVGEIVERLAEAIDTFKDEYDDAPDPA